MPLVRGGGVGFGAGDEAGLGAVRLRPPMPGRLPIGAGL
jgi:hypothetical protein